MDLFRQSKEKDSWAYQKRLRGNMCTARLFQIFLTFVSQLDSEQLSFSNCPAILLTKRNWYFHGNLHMIPCSLNIYHGNTTIVWTLQRYVYLDEYHDTTFFFLYWYHDMVMFCETAMLLFLSVFADVRYIGNTIIMVLLWFLWTFSTTLLCFLTHTMALPWCS